MSKVKGHLAKVNSESERLCELEEAARISRRLQATAAAHLWEQVNELEDRVSRLETRPVPEDVV